MHDGSAIEIVSFDPRQGAIFYLLDERKVDKPVFQRAELDCTQCHIAPGTRGVPGVLLRSVFPTSSGTLVPGAPSHITDQESPLKQRWGGWYASGVLSKTSMANAVADQASVAGAPPATVGATGAPPPQLNPLGDRSFDPSAYLASGSDQVALLVLTHQAQMHNLITLTNYQTRLALYALAKADGAAAQQSADAPSLDSLPEATRRQIQKAADQLVRFLLFSNETPLGGLDARQVIKETAFARSEFAARGIRDSKGRSLRDFDLHDRIFKYPCSYLIYNLAFDTLPEPAKGYVYHRLLQVLTGQDQSPDFANLSASDRDAILSILIQTKPGLPDEWQDYAHAKHLKLAAFFPGQTRQQHRAFINKPTPVNRRNTAMKTLFTIAALTSVLMSGSAVLAAGSSDATALDGRWDAVLTRNGTDIAFRLDIKGSGDNLQGVFYDGFRPYDGTTSASFSDGKLTTECRALPHHHQCDRPERPA